MNLDYLFDNWRRVLDLSIDHLQLSTTAIILALAFALPIGLFVARYEKSEVLTLGVLSTLYVIPSLAVLAILIPFLGLGVKPAVVTLAIYAQIFLVRNIVAGLRGVDRSILESAEGVGMSRVQVFARVHLPLALPVILAGIRIAFVATISLATITAWVNAGGLGSLLFDGITRNNPSMILAGTIAVVALALGIDLFLRFIESLTAIQRARRASR